MMRQAGESDHGLRLRALIVVLWRAGLRVGEAMALTEPDLDLARGALLAPRSELLGYPYTALKGKLFLRLTRFLFARDWAAGWGGAGVKRPRPPTAAKATTLKHRSVGP